MILRKLHCEKKGEEKALRKKWTERKRQLIKIVHTLQVVYRKIKSEKIQ